MKGWITLCDNKCKVYICGVKKFLFWKKGKRDARGAIRGLHARRKYRLSTSPFYRLMQKFRKNAFISLILGPTTNYRSSPMRLHTRTTSLPTTGTRRTTRCPHQGNFLHTTHIRRRPRLFPANGHRSPDADGCCAWPGRHGGHVEGAVG